MLNKMDEINLYGRDPGDVVEALEMAEAALAEGGEPAAEEATLEARARELKAAGKSYSFIAREILGAKTVSAYYINKVKKMLGETTPEATTAEGSGKPRRGGGRRKIEPPAVSGPEQNGSRQKAPNDDAGGHPLALGNGHLNGNGNAGGMVALSPAQLSRLWEIITGGQVGFRVEAGHVTCLVSESSFKKALPVLLDQLGGAK